MWRDEFRFPTRLDRVGLTISVMAYTSMRRVGTFLPAKKKDAEKFSWIVPKFIRYFDDTQTLLI